MHRRGIVLASLTLLILLTATPILAAHANAASMEGGLLPTAEIDWIVGYYYIKSPGDLTSDISVTFSYGSAEENNLITLKHNTKWDGLLLVDVVVFVRAAKLGDDETLLYYLGGEKLTAILLGGMYMPSMALVGYKVIEKTGWKTVNPYKKLYIHKSEIEYSKKLFDYTPVTEHVYSYSNKINVSETEVEQKEWEVETQVRTGIAQLGVSASASVEVTTTEISSNTYEISWSVSFEYYTYTIRYSLELNATKQVDLYVRPIGSNYWYLADQVTYSMTVSKEKDIYMITSDPEATTLMDID